MVAVAGDVLLLVGWLMLAGQVAITLLAISLGIIVSLVIKAWAGE